MLDLSGGRVLSLNPDGSDIKAQVPVTFCRRPKDAPVCHLGGPLTVFLKWGEEGRPLIRGSNTSLDVMIGTPGLPPRPSREPVFAPVATSEVPADAHPVLKGINPFHINDEAYKNLYMSDKIKPLLTTDNPTSDVNLAWIGPCTTARVIAIQLGHGHSAFGHPAYRTLVHNAVLWAAGKDK